MKAALNYLPASIAPKLSALTVTLVGAHMLDPVNLGYFAFVILVGEVCEMTALAWTRIQFIKAGSEPSGVNRAILSQAFVAGIVLSFLASLSAAIFAVTVLDERSFEVATALLVYIFGNSGLRLGLTSLQISDNKRAYNLIEICRSFLQFLATLACFNYLNDFFYASIGSSTVALLLGIVALFISWTETKHGYEIKESQELSLKSGLPIVILTALGFSVSSMDRMLVSANYPVDILAKYGLAYAIGRQGFDIVGGSINTHSFPRFLRVTKTAAKRAAAQNLRTTIMTLTFIMLPAAGVLLAAGQTLSNTVLPESYAAAVHTSLPLVAIGAIALNIKTFAFDNIFHAYNKNYLQIPSLCVGACAGAATFSLTEFQSPYAKAGLAFAVSSVTSLIIAVALSSTILKVTLPVKSILYAGILATISYIATNIVCAIPVWVPVQIALATLSGIGFITLGGLVVKFIDRVE